MTIKFNIYIADWITDKPDIRNIRETVFIEEQSVPAELEWDEDDKSCTHFLVSSDGSALATARLLKNGQIGRMAVLKKYRGLGIGSHLLDYILEHAKKIGMKSTYVHAQETAINFYLKKGYKSCGGIFLEANIYHQKMEKTFNK